MGPGFWAKPFPLFRHGFDCTTAIHTLLVLATPHTRCDSFSSHSSCSPLPRNPSYSSPFIVSVFVIHTRCFRHSSSPRYIVCSYHVHPCHGTYLPRSRSSILATECTRHGVIRPRHTCIRYGVVCLGSTYFCRHSHSLCLSSPPRHDICFRHSPLLSLSSPRRLRFHAIFACIDGDPSFASSVVVLPRIRFLTPQDLPPPDPNRSSSVLASSCLLQVFVIPSFASSRSHPGSHHCHVHH